MAVQPFAPLGWQISALIIGDAVSGSQLCLIADLVSARGGTAGCGGKGHQPFAGSVLHSALLSETTQQSSRTQRSLLAGCRRHSRPPAARKTPALVPSDAAGTYIPVKVQAAGNVANGWEQLTVRLPSGLPRGAVQLEVARGGYTSPAKVSHAHCNAYGAFPCQTLFPEDLKSPSGRAVVTAWRGCFDIFSLQAATS